MGLPALGKIGAVVRDAIVDRRDKKTSPYKRGWSDYSRGIALSDGFSLAHS
jgi:hypothetical protein